MRQGGEARRGEARRRGGKAWRGTASAEYHCISTLLPTFPTNQPTNQPYRSTSFLPSTASSYPLFSNIYKIGFSMANSIDPICEVKCSDATHCRVRGACASEESERMRCMDERVRECMNIFYLPTNPQPDPPLFVSSPLPFTMYKNNIMLFRLVYPSALPNGNALKLKEQV